MNRWFLIMFRIYAAETQMEPENDERSTFA